MIVGPTSDISKRSTLHPFFPSTYYVQLLRGECSNANSSQYSDTCLYSIFIGGGERERNCPRVKSTSRRFENLTQSRLTVRHLAYSNTQVENIGTRVIIAYFDMIVLDGVQEPVVHTYDVKSRKEILYCSDVISHQRQLQRRVRQFVSTTTRCNQDIGSQIS